MAGQGSGQGNGMKSGDGAPALRARLFVRDRLAEGAAVGLSANQAHYLRHVLRLDKGARVALFNGIDGEWTGRVDGFGKGWASVALDGRRRPQGDEPDLWLLFAPIKHGRIDYLVQKAAELGVSRILPVLTDFTQVARVNTDRLAANAVEAAEQTGRLSVPEVAEPSRLGAVLGAWDPARRLMLCDESGRGGPVNEVLSALAPGGPWAVLIGPEGGFSEAELDALRKLSFVIPVSLGPRILRADTAAVAALACWQAALGDWRHETPGA